MATCQTANFLASLFTACCLLSSSVTAQDGVPIPSGTIVKIIVPFAPGGPPDVIFRILAPSLGQALGKTVIIENRSGRSTAIAAVQVARAAPDGNTLLACDVSFVVAPHILNEAGFDPLKDFNHVGIAATSQLALVSSARLPATSVTELLAKAKESPNDYMIAHSGSGSGPHLGAISFTQSNRLNLTLVPYRGAGLAVNDLAGGHVALLFSTPSTSLGLAKQGLVRILAVTGHERLPAIPDVPTFEEKGIAMNGIGDGVWFGLSAPAATPPSVVANLNAALNKTLKDKNVIEQLERLGFTPAGGRSDLLTKQIQSQFIFWGDAMREAGVQRE